MNKYDAVIIGSGQGGTPLAKKLAKAGWRTAIIESGEVGGTCINVGCTPTKTMIASAKAAHTVANAANWGVEVKGFSINIKTVLARKNKIVEMFREGANKGLTQTENLTLIKGEASFTRSNKIEVRFSAGGKEIFEAENIFINTGATTAIPNIKGLENINYYTSTTLMELEAVPEHLVIIGSGYIGLEFGQLYKRLGSKITIIEKAGRILAKEDEDVSEEMERILNSEDITIYKNTKVTEIKNDDKNIDLIVSTGDKEKTIKGSHLLIAAGRKPNTARLNLSVANIETDEKGYIKVDDKLQTSVKGIYAIGDVKGGLLFTHVAYNDHLILWHNLVKKENRTTTNRLVPYCVFTDPQLGRAGVTETQAKEQGLNFKVAKFPGKHIARAIEMGNTAGFMKVIINTEDDSLLGVAIIGEEGGEVMSILQMAMLGNIKWPQLREMIFAHPLYAESINNLFMQFD